MNPNKKYLDLGLGGAALAFWLVVRQALTTLWDVLRLPIQENWPVSIPALVAFVLALMIFVALKRNARVNEFGLEVITELSKVTWPTRKETVISAGVVIVMVGIASMLMFFFDTAWGTIARSLLEL